MIHLSDYMAQNNLSDADVAVALNLTRASVSRFRRRKMRPDWKTIEKIKEFTGGKVTADDFVSIEDFSSKSREAAE